MSGVKHTTADAASRYPSGSPDVDTLQLPDDIDDTKASQDIHPLHHLHTLLAGVRCIEPELKINSIDASIHDCAIGALAHASVT